MDLHLTLAAGPGVTLPSGGATEEIVVNGSALATGDQLRTELARRSGAEHFSVAGQPIESLIPGVPPLTNGAVIVVATAHQHDEAQLPIACNLLFVVRTGPDAGKVVPLVRGTYRIGRSAPEIPIHDPELSRTHAVLTVTNEAIKLTDRKSANGIWVDGSRVQEAVITTDSTIRVGASECALFLTDRPVPAADVVNLSEPWEVAAPVPPERNRLLLVTALLPLILGVVLALTTGMWFFLAFSALSAVTGLVPLLSGRKKRAAFTAAVTAAAASDEERRRRAAHDVAELALMALQSRLTPLGPIAEGPPQRGRYLRLGIADQAANLLIKPKPAEWCPPVIRAAPLTVPLFAPSEPAGEEPLNLTITGSADTLRGVAHLLLLQLSVLKESGGIICYGAGPDLPQAARFLPRVSLVADPERLDQQLATGECSTLLLFGGSAGAILSLPRLRVYRFCKPSTPAENGGWVVDYSPEQPVLVSAADRTHFEPDLVQHETFEYLSRALATSAAPRSGRTTAASIPDEIALKDLLASDTGTVAQRWQGSSDGSCLPAVVGYSRDGALALDLVSDGPHLLVAGTTGSGKSEFLRTMVLSLCLTQSPADLNFLFIDFKGGSGLGVLATLPHVTGMLTDLSAAAVSRALISLKAEVKRREELFAACGATDYLEYRAGTPAENLPRIAIVIDEFRMLSEEVPGSVQELMRIATLGRSLGLHLVLATQRPQGAVTSDIRANVTASVALRMQSPMESQDVLESPVAASIPVHLRGRGFLRVGGQFPVEFQTATTSGGGVSAHTAAIASLAQYLGNEPRPDSDQPLEDSSSGIDRVVAAVQTATCLVRLPALREPVLPMLPTELLPDAAGQSDTPYLGLLDVPESQKQYRLAWRPEQDSHLAFVGQPAGGLSAALRYAAGQALEHFPDSHLYVLDGDGSLRLFAAAPQTGAYVTASETKRAARVIQRMAGIVQCRLGATHDQLQTAAPAVTVLISGWGRWAGSFRSGRYAWAEEAILDIARDGEVAGVTLVIGGERELISSRFFSLLPNRLFFPAGMSPESLLSWPKMPALDPVAGRAYVQGRVSTAGGAVAQLILQSPDLAFQQPTLRPFPIAALPRRVNVNDLAAPPPDNRLLRIPVGVGGDDLSTVYLAMPPRGVALVVGPPGSGRSHTLDLLARLAPTGSHCVRPEAGHDPAAFWQEAAAAGASGRDLLLVDDADQLPRESHQHLAHLASSGARVVLASSPSIAAVSAIPLVAAMRTAPLGIVLGARSPSDGDAFGIRLEIDGRGPEGRGFLIDASGAFEVQIADYRPETHVHDLAG